MIQNRAKVAHWGDIILGVHKLHLPYSIMSLLWYAYWYCRLGQCKQQPRRFTNHKCSIVKTLSCNEVTVFTCSHTMLRLITLRSMLSIQQYTVLKNWGRGGYLQRWEEVTMCELRVRQTSVTGRETSYTLLTFQACWDKSLLGLSKVSVKSYKNMNYNKHWSDDLFYLWKSQTKGAFTTITCIQLVLQL